MGQRSRKRRAGAATVAAPPPPGTASKPDASAQLKRGYARGEARNQAIRDQLVPLEPGERPRAVTIAAVAAALLGIANLVFLLVGYEVRGEQPAVPGVLILSGLLLTSAIGMWRREYWAILGFQALLGITLVIALLSLLLRAQDLRGVAVCVLILATAGPLFWSLVRAMARIQMPERPRRDAT